MLLYKTAYASLNIPTETKKINYIMEKVLKSNDELIRK